MFRKKQITKFELNNKTAYLTGVILGDGHLAKGNKSKTSKFKDYKIDLDFSDIQFLKHTLLLIKSIAPTTTQAKNYEKRINRKPRLRIQLRNKELFTFFSEQMEIPQGAKSSIIKTPELIKNSNSDIKKYFLAGYFDTDGGVRGDTLGFTTASITMQKDVSQLLKELNIKHSLERWINKKYNKVYYGIKLKRSEIDKFLNILPLRNFEKLSRIRQRFKRGDTKVAKWDSVS